MNGFKKELTNILSFWSNKMVDLNNGGFYGQITGNNTLIPDANKGAILNARILWTFSSAYRITKVPEYLKIAERAFEYIRQYFIDPVYGGVFWEIDSKAKPVNKKKQVYAQGFALYGFSEYFRITKNPEVLALAKEFFFLIEKCRDNERGGYYEAFTESWEPIEDMRLSEKDANEKKTMNTHLHILEPYTNLCRIWDYEPLREAQKQLIESFAEHILNSGNNHLQLFFDENWVSKSKAISYGHDIEASWLLYEAACVLNDSLIIEKIKKISLDIAQASSEGLNADGSMSYEKEGDHIDRERHWWVQAETVVGYMYAYKNSGNSRYLEYAQKCWEYIQNQIIDTENGEWIWSRKSDGSINELEDKAGFWKCPYHNSRMCMEMIENFNLN